MKSLVTLVIVLLSTVSIAKSDSVAFFYSNTKVVVVINELNPYGRLSNFIDNVSNNQTYRFENIESKISCSRNDRGAGCRFIFKPSTSVIIENRTLNAEIPLANMLEESAIGFKMTFNSSMNDKFSLKISKNNKLIITGSKILRTSQNKDNIE
jgi:hypothetical protein